MNYYPQQSYPAYKPYFQPQPQYQQPPVYQPQPIQMPPMEQDGSIAARFASGREEAVASFVVPGRPAIFYDRAGGCIFVKSVDPQTGAAEIKTFVDLDHKKEDRSAQQQQYATIEMLIQIKNEMEQRFQALMQAQAQAIDSGKAVKHDAE